MVTQNVIELGLLDELDVLGRFFGIILAARLVLIFFSLDTPTCYYDFSILLD